MNSWEDFIWLITNPYFIAFFLFALALEPLLKYVRRFYPETLQKAANDSERFIEELHKNTEDRKVFLKANLKIVLFIFGPTLIFLFIYIAYMFFTGSELKPIFLKEAFGKVATIVIITIGLYAIKTDQVHRLLFKHDYQKVMELTRKQIGSDPFYKYYEKYSPIFGYFFLFLGVIGFVMQVFFESV